MCTIRQGIGRTGPPQRSRSSQHSNPSRAGRVVARILVGVGFAGAICGAAYAQSSGEASPAAPVGLWQRANLLGDMGGLRPAWQSRGITLGLQEISEILGRDAGGSRAGEYEGLTTLDLGLDADKAFGWSGGSFNLSVLQIHANARAADDLNNLAHVSGIAASRTTRLWELWYDQAFADGKTDVKVGQQSVDQEFLNSQNAATFMNTMMGWPMLPADDLYGGGPAYPLSSLGVRLRVQVSPAWTVLGGVFNDNPPGGPFNDDSQTRGAEASGTRFNLNTGALWIGEVQYAPHASPAKDCGSLTCGLPGTYKLGGWYDTGRFPDQHYDTNGMSLADPASNGIARMHRGNYSVYAVADQMVWREVGGPRSVGVFARVMGAPSDRNLMNYAISSGVVVKATFSGRDDDAFGVGLGWSNVSGNARGLDRDAQRFSGLPSPLRTAGRFVDITYQYQVAPWWQLQPDVQHVHSPSGGMPDPLHPTRWLGSEWIISVRTTISF